MSAKGEGTYVPEVNMSPSHINQYVFNSRFVLDACIDFLRMNFEEGIESDHMIAVAGMYLDEIDELNVEIIGDDFST